MSVIVTTTHVQRQMGKISETIEHTPYIVTNKGLGHIIMLPYVDGCDDWISDYMEEYEMKKNKMILKKGLQASLDSGLSDLEV